MIKTLRGANGSFASLGQPETQPVSDPVSQVRNQTTQRSSVLSSGLLAAHQAPLLEYTVSGTGSDLHINTDASLNSMVKSLASDPTFLIPPLRSNSNVVMPAYALHLDPSKMFDKSALGSLASMPVRKLQPYEQLTGISQERPEVVMLLNFLPLFERDTHVSNGALSTQLELSGDDPLLTAAGRYVDLHVNIRNMRHTNMVSMINSIRTQFASIGNDLVAQKSDFERNVSKFETYVTFLMNLVRTVHKINSQLDLRDDLHVVDTQAASSRFIANYTRSSVTAKSQGLHDIAKLYIPDTYSPVDALSRVGYRSENVRSVFSSTKVWMQLMLELQYVLSHHSAEFIDTDPTLQRNDNDPTKVVRSNLKYFEFRTQLPNVPSLSELSNVKPVQTLQVASTINQAYRSMYEDVHLKSDDVQISALAHIVSKEYRYSVGLSMPEVQRSLSDQFSFTPALNGNLSVFDAIIGQVGNNVFDIPASSRSLTGLAQRKPSSATSVLTFESKYIEADNGTYTPGSTYYVDSVLNTDGKNFNTENVDELANTLDQTFRNFSIVTNGMNLFANQTYDPSDANRRSFGNLLSNPLDVVSFISQQIIDVTSGETLPTMSADTLGGIYSLAASNDLIKSTLFMYTVAKMTRAYNNPLSFLASSPLSDNTPLTDNIIELLINNIQTVVPSSKSGAQIADVQMNSSTTTATIALSREAIRNSMKAGTITTTIVESIMIQALSAFKDSSSLVGGFTRYTNCSDTVLMMAIFDLVVKLISKLNNQALVSMSAGTTTFGKNVTTFLVTRNSSNHRNTVQSITTRLSRETALVQMLIYTIMNSLQRLSDSTNGFSNYLKSQPALENLRSISSIVNDVDQLRLLLSEQQIMQVASTMYDLKDRLVASPVNDTSDTDSDGDFDVDDVFKVLDDSSMQPKLRDALFGMMGTEDYASRKGYNKKVLSVGIPLGFSKHLQQKINTNKLKKSSFVDKQNDIITLAVYKTDLQNSDIIYKPQRFKFELTRFPVRNEGKFMPFSKNPTMNDLINALPTRDMGDSTSVSNDVTYMSPSAQKITFDDESYYFLTQQDKVEIVRNHVTSYLLEVYTSLLTGMSIAEHHFDIVEQPRPVNSQIIKKLVDGRLKQVTDVITINSKTSNDGQPSSGGVIFSTTSGRSKGATLGSSRQSASKLTNSSGTANGISLAAQFGAVQDASSRTSTSDQQSPGGTADSSLAAISTRNVSSAVHDLRTISSIAHVISPIADGAFVMKRLLSPKQFDRVFNVCIDPDDFEIDYDATVRSEHGKMALQQMINNGDIVPSSENDRLVSLIKGGMISIPPGLRNFVQSRNAPNVNSYKYRDRDKGSGDLAFEKYFVSIETFGEENV